MIVVMTDGTVGEGNANEESRLRHTLRHQSGLHGESQLKIVQPLEDLTMDHKIAKLSDGTLQFTITMNEAELDEHLRVLDLLEADMPSEDDAVVSAAGDAEILRKKGYCCTCSGMSTRTKNVYASSTASAHMKCLKHCGGPYGLSKGTCV
ncbi:MAG: hypothetical protein RLN72_16450 [Henriciella sp.]